MRYDIETVLSSYTRVDFIGEHTINGQTIHTWNTHTNSQIQVVTSVDGDFIKTNLDEHGLSVCDDMIKTNLKYYRKRNTNKKGSI